MTTCSRTRSVARWLAIGVGVAAAAYATYAGITWFRYGRPPRSPETADQDPLLDRFMPMYDVAERHHIRVGAPADITLAAAGEANLLQSPIARAIFRAREVVLGSEPDRAARGLLTLTQMGTSLTGEPRDVALRDALSSVLQK